MAYTIPTQRTTGTLITSAIYNTDLVDNLVASANPGAAVSILKTTAAGALTLVGLTLSGDLAVDGGDITSSAVTFNLLNATVTTLNIGGAATVIALGAASTVITLGSNATINGGAAGNDDLTLQGTSHATRTTSYVLLQPNGGNVGIGTTAPISKLHITGGVTTVDNDKLAIRSDSNGASTGYQYSLDFRRSDGTITTPAIVAVDDALGSMDWQGYDGAAFISAARIGAFVDGTPGTNDMPGRLTFLTTLDGAASPTERMRITNSGNVGIGMSPTKQLELSTDSAQKPTTNTWTITSDLRTKDAIKQRPFVNGLNWLKGLPPPIYFTYNGIANTPEGEEGIGWNAQDLLLVAPGMVHRAKGKLTPKRAKDDKGNLIPTAPEVLEALPETELLGVNTHEMHFAIFNAIRELDARVSALGG